MVALVALFPFRSMQGQGSRQSRRTTDRFRLSSPPTFQLWRRALRPIRPSPSARQVAASLVASDRERVMTVRVALIMSRAQRRPAPCHCHATRRLSQHHDKPICSRHPDVAQQPRRSEHWQNVRYRPCRCKGDKRGIWFH